MSAIEWLTLGLLLVTGVYAGLTFWLASTTAKQVWENNRAQIIASLSLHQGGNIMHLVIKNVGRGTARNCRLSISPDVHSTFSEETVAGTNAFKRPVRAFPPEFAWHFALGQPHIWLSSRDRAKFPMLFTINSEYDTAGQTVSESHEIDIEALLYGPTNRDDASKFYFDMPGLMENLNKSLANVEKSVKSLGDHQ